MQKDDSIIPMGTVEMLFGGLTKTMQISGVIVSPGLVEDKSPIT